MSTNLHILQSKVDNLKLIWKGLTLPHLNPNSNYKDLGILTNLNLNFDQQLINITNGTRLTLAKISGLKLSVHNKIHLINKIIIPKINYTTNSITFTDQRLKKINLMIVNMVKRSLKLHRTPNQCSGERLWLQKTHGRLELNQPLQFYSSFLHK